MDPIDLSEAPWPVINNACDQGYHDVCKTYCKGLVRGTSWNSEKGTFGSMRCECGYHSRAALTTEEVSNAAS